PPLSPAGTPCTQAVTVGPAARATEPSSVTRTLTVTVAIPLAPNTSAISNVAPSPVAPCHEPEPACTAGNPTPPELTTSKTLSLVNGNPAAPGQTVLPGEELTYLITVENHGGTQATTTLTDRVPANTSYTGPGSQRWDPTCVT